MNFPFGTYLRVVDDVVADSTADCAHKQDREQEQKTEEDEDSGPHLFVVASVPVLCAHAIAAAVSAAVGPLSAHGAFV